MSYSTPIPITHTNYESHTSQYAIVAIGERATIINGEQAERIGFDLSKSYELLVYDNDGNLVFEIDTEDDDTLPTHLPEYVCLRFEIETVDTFLPSAMKLLRSSGPNSRSCHQLEYAGTTYQGWSNEMLITEDSGKPCHVIFV